MENKKLNNFISDLKEISEERGKLSLTLQLIDAGIKGDKDLFEKISNEFCSNKNYVRALEIIANSIDINHAEFNNKPLFEFEETIIEKLKTFSSNLTSFNYFEKF